MGVARVLVYLHNHAPVSIVHHRDVISWSILLDMSLEPKLFDFRFAMSKAFNETDGFETQKIDGTPGYIAPKAFSLSTKTDVFNFGELVLETITGRKAFYTIKEGLKDYVWRNWNEGTFSNIIDRRIIIDGNISCITKLIQIGLLCVEVEATDRPTMEEVVAMMLDTSSAPLPTPQKSSIDQLGVNNDSDGSEASLRVNYDSNGSEESLRVNYDLNDSEELLRLNYESDDSDIGFI